MERRVFLKSLGISVAFVACGGSNLKGYSTNNTSVDEIGHLLRNKASFPKVDGGSIDHIIIGGGVVGMTAACRMKQEGESFQLFELAPNLGGTSSAGEFNGMQYSQGAHYELAYPDYYGEELIEFLKELNIIQWDESIQLWNFVDQQYIIPKEKEQQVYQDGNYRTEMFPDCEWTTQFEQLMDMWEGEFGLPLRIYTFPLKMLNEITFKAYLHENLGPNPEMERLVDHQMIDDYGAKSDQISALAGVAYYACRPYYKRHVPVFSPPQGNAYFVEKMYNHLDDQKSSVFKNHLIASIHRKGENDYELEIIDVLQKQVKIVQTRELIFAGKQFLLPYIFPEVKQYVLPTKYAPWAVFSFMLDGFHQAIHWQNEMITEDEGFMGFINLENKCLNVYYCLKPEERSKLLDWKNDPDQIISPLIQKLNEYLGVEIQAYLTKVLYHPIGHGMAICEPGYLGQDINERIPFNDFKVVGVDNGRLPLFAEAIASAL